MNAPPVMNALMIATIAGVVVIIVGTIVSGRPHERAEAEKSQRFTYESVGGMNFDLYVVTDHQTGKKYLATYHGGIVEIAP